MPEVGSTSFKLQLVYILIHKVRPTYFWDLFLIARDLIKNLTKKENNI